MAEGLKVVAEHAAQLTGGAKTMAAGVSMTLGSKVWAWLGANNEQITSIGTLIGIAIAVAGYVQARRDRNKRNDSPSR